MADRGRHYLHPTTTTGEGEGFGSGITIREHFAAMAMQGLLATTRTSAPDVDEVTGKAVEFADALIAALRSKP
jgi:hypothetical protein